VVDFDRIGDFLVVVDFAVVDSVVLDSVVADSVVADSGTLYSELIVLFECSFATGGKDRSSRLYNKSAVAICGDL